MVILFFDILIITGSSLFSLWISFDFQYEKIPQADWMGFCWSMPYWILSTISVFYGCRLYHSIWSFASVHELERMVAAYVILIPVYGIGAAFMHLHMPKTYFFISYVLSFILCTGIRFSYRFLRN